MGTISLVGHHNGRKIIRWGYVILAFLLITIAGSAFGVGLYAVFTRAWHPVALLIGPGAGVVVTGIALAVSFSAPAHRLPFLKRPPR